MSRPSIRPALRGLTFAALLATAACSSTAPVAPASAVSRIETVTYGVVVSLRPTTVPPDTLATILHAVGDVPGSATAATAITPATTAATVEFIVREDNGNTISVVQPNEDNLQAGDRVVLRRSARLRVARAPTS